MFLFSPVLQNLPTQMSLKCDCQSVPQNCSFAVFTLIFIEMFQVLDLKVLFFLTCLQRDFWKVLLIHERSWRGEVKWRVQLYRLISSNYIQRISKWEGKRGIFKSLQFWVLYWCQENEDGMTLLSSVLDFIVEEPRNPLSRLKSKLTLCNSTKPISFIFLLSHD